VIPLRLNLAEIIRAWLGTKDEIDPANLTANAYTDVGMRQLAAAVQKLPPPVRPKAPAAGPAAAEQGPEAA